MAGRIKVIKIIEEKWIHTPFFSVPANSRSEVEVPDYSPNDADHEWVKTQIGDVPYRNTAEQWSPAELEGLAYLIEHSKRYEFNRIPDYFVETVPVESLGRES